MLSMFVRSSMRLVLSVGVVVAATVDVQAAPPVKKTAAAKVKAKARADWRDAVAWQAALDRAGFSPGVIDGAIGPKTRAALEQFQRNRGLEVTGLGDGPTRTAIGIDSAPPLTTVTLTTRDRADISPQLTDWNKKAALKHLGYHSLTEVAAARGHCSQRLLARLNPKLNLAKLKPGDTLTVPNVESGMAKSPSAKALQVDLASKRITLLDDAGKTVALFHCSIAEKQAKRPKGRAVVETLVENPEYTFDPKMWPEVKNVNRVLQIPAGPRNPVGTRWIGLNLPGYGIHGTPTPELIGKTGSHGCIRLANWDAERLATMVRIGMEVRFVDSTEAVARGN